MHYLEKNRSCHVVIAEKTDRLYRNLRDPLTLEDLDIGIHLPKDNQVISKGAQSQTRLMHGFHILMARNYVENLREEVQKGMREKAEQGIYPSRPPIGYRNNKAEKTIEIDPGKAPLARRMFELYATGNYSLSQLRKVIKREFGQQLAKGYLDRLLKNPFYVGSFVWQGKVFAGTHSPLVEREQFDQVQDVFHVRNKPKYRKHAFAFQGLLRCAHDNCAVTAEIKKQKYTYYRCTGHRGPCDLPYMREEVLRERLGQIVKDIFIPGSVLAQLENSLLNDRGRQEAIKGEQSNRLRGRLNSVRGRLDQSYIDKLDGKISEDFWARKSDEWRAEEQRICAELLALEQVLVQPEMEKRRSPLVSIPPFGRGFSRHGVFRSDGGWAAQERALTPPFIVSMSPPGYPSAWLRPRSARFRFARQNHCNSATSCRFSTSGLPVAPPEPRPARPES